MKDMKGVGEPEQNQHGHPDIIEVRVVVVHVLLPLRRPGDKGLACRLRPRARDEVVVVSNEA